jgi:UDP-N-acetylglucosamine 2-epimerase (non-hydrolysing)
MGGGTPLVLSIVGTRPEAIKMAPVVRALGARRRIAQQVVLTGQHRGLAGHFGDLQVPLRELPYDPSGRTPARLRETLHHILCGHFRKERIDLVLVQGDTASAFAGALAARDCGIAVGHVEAGLRSFDLTQPWPEEGNRVAIDALADLLFAPTEAAAANLRNEWRVKGRIWMTGNSGIDALLQARARLPRREAPPPERKPVLLTCHRKENQGEPAAAVCEAVKRMVRELPVAATVLLHPNRHARRAVEEALAGVEHVTLREPVEHDEMVRLMQESWLILTDSGGLQEEAPALGRPVLVLRNVTERAEALASGNIALVGTDTARIVAAVGDLLRDSALYGRMSRPSFPFGDGRASERIAAAVEAWLVERRANAA